MRWVAVDEHWIGHLLKINQPTLEEIFSRYQNKHFTAMNLSYKVADQCRETAFCHLIKATFHVLKSCLSQGKGSTSIEF
jgi:hypothetical protein